MNAGFLELEAPLIAGFQRKVGKVMEQRLSRLLDKMTKYFCTRRQSASEYLCWGDATRVVGSGHHTLLLGLLFGHGMAQDVDSPWSELLIES